MSPFISNLKNSKLLIGMIHLDALPGTPKNRINTKTIIRNTLTEAEKLINAQFHAVLIENMHDVPYLNKNIGHEISCLMAVIAYELKKQFNIPIGLQILAAANKQALAAALAADIDFIRAEGFVYAHVADEGIIDSCAGDLLRYRKQINAEHIAIFTDIKKKHASHALTADTSISETAQAAAMFLSDGLIITGSTTGKEASINDLKEVNKATSLPIIIGSGISINNLEKYYELANAFIVGSSIKENGKWFNTIDPNSAKQLSKKMANLKSIS